MLGRIICLGALVVMGSWSVTPVRSASIPIENASFESPVVDPNGFSALPFVDGWTEIDADTETSTNTGVFANPAPASPGRLVNADGDQLAFLGSQTGNAIEQDLIDTYRTGCDYRLTVAVGISGLFPPAATEPVDTLELVLYYRDGPNTVDIACEVVEAVGLSSTKLKDFTLYLTPVRPGDALAGTTIGVALRATGMPGGFWDIDNVRLTESPPVSIAMDNASFEAPAVDPNGFGALPFINGWTEIDLDTETSTNTGVFANPALDSPGRLINADGDQLAFLGSQTGNALEQDLADSYRPGRDYHLTVGVGVSGLFPPSTVEPTDNLNLLLYYRSNDLTGVVTGESHIFTYTIPITLDKGNIYVPSIVVTDSARLDTYTDGDDYTLALIDGRVQMKITTLGAVPPNVSNGQEILVDYNFFEEAESVDIVHRTVKATGLSSTQLQDVSLYLPTVQLGDAWAGQTIGVALRAAGMPGGFWDLDDVRLVESVPKSVPIDNASFEAPIVDPNGFSALPFIDGWTEIDLDTETSTNTGVFANPALDSPGRLVNADGSQLAFLGSQTGNALEQDMAATYKVGCDYGLSVAVGVSGMFPPSMAEMVDMLELVLYYRDGTNVVDIVAQQVEATGLSSTELMDFSLHLPPVQPGDAWAGTAIGVALRAAGMPGGFWDIDDVRLVESQVGPDPALTGIE